MLGHRSMVSSTQQKGALVSNIKLKVNNNLTQIITRPWRFGWRRFSKSWKNMNKLLPSACIKSHPPCWDSGRWTMPGAGPVCRCDAPCSAVWPPGRHESSVQSCSACRWAHNSCRQLCRQLSDQWSDVQTTLCCLLSVILYLQLSTSDVQIWDYYFFQFIKQCSLIIYR